MSAAEISRLAGVTRATVSNWRRRHDDFPDPVAGNESRPLFDLHAVQEWLASHGIDAAQSPEAELRTLVRSHATPQAVTKVMEVLHRTEDGWSASRADDRKLASEVAAALRSATSTEQVRTTLDILSERAMDDAASTGVYVTPPAVASMMAALLRSATTPAVRSVLDPACGSGNLLLAAAQCGAEELYGQDSVPVQVQRARLLIEAETALEPAVRAGDSLTADAFPDLRVDAVLCNPPYGQRDWGSGELAFDTRWDYGLPPRGEPELAWVQHAIAHLRPGGIAALLLPPAVATRTSGRKIRSNLVRAGALRAVIGLTPGVAQPWHVGLQIWVVRRPEAGAPVPESMLFVDTAGEARQDGDRLGQDAVIALWQAFDEGSPARAAESGVSAVVRLVDLLDEEVDLTPARYVRSALDSGAVYEQVDAALDSLRAAATDLAGVLAEVPGWAESRGKSWRFIGIADLINHGQLQWFRAAPPGSARPPGDCSVLTAPDVANGTPASGTMDSVPDEPVEVWEGDVLMPAVRSDRSGGRTARVATAQDAGAVLGPHVHALRGDRSRLDPWFLAGFLTGAENVSAIRTSTVRFDLSRLRVPVLSLEEQRRYGALFRQLFLLRTVAHRASAAADHTAELITTGLTAGALVPQDEHRKDK
ncbi:SAM-dependent methyltransferase [Nocardia nova]|uniref:N-6 DNA methylase n=1 Tax=Nocardia nova TaxID=37330 RepID=UPI0025AF8412|nr:N-6 DNA methylase [Nocardia nova]MDN2495163.1 SAM-dependent methyltransferase [Nocardia nova]